MKAIGIPVWAARVCSTYDDCLPDEPVSEQIRHDHPHAPSALNLIDSLESSPPSASVSSIPEVSQPVKAKTIPISSDAEALSWADLQTTVSRCKQCDMHRFRQQAVFGSGNLSASWMFIGEAPDVEEDAKGGLFLGKAGHLLDNILSAINLNRESVYLANIIKCRPPNDRAPHVDEITNCLGYLQRQIELVEPKVIVVVGRLAAQQLLQSKETIGKMRGRVHHLAKTNIPVIVTYHPRYLLRQASEKRKVWEDIKLARSIVQS